jgi:hypothetical protein
VKTTTVALFTQLEERTRSFRDGLARRHRAKWTAANQRARNALDHWEPEPLGLTNRDDGEVLSPMPEPVVQVTHPDRYVGVGKHRGALRTVVPATHVEVEQHPVFDDHFRTKVATVFQDSTTWVQDQVARARSMAKWHTGRDNGQKYRFKRLDQCGARVMVATCGACNGERKAVEEGCGIARLCERCSLRKAKKRRARFGRARERVAVALNRLGCLRRRRVRNRLYSPRWTDKMLTLTLPHVLRCDVDPERIARGGKRKLTPLFQLAHDAWGLAPEEIDTTMMRILAVRAAWSIFARKLRAYWKELDDAARKAHAPRVMMPWKDDEPAPPPMHRAFEWTPGDDQLGHPHYHLWLLCPWVDADELALMWTEAVRAAGIPCEQTVIIKLQRFRDFDRNAVGELIKAGDRSALEWQRLYARGRRGGPANAFEYADGWTIADALRGAAAADDEDERRARTSVVASLYCALEGMRLTQASAGFFAADEPAHCERCKAQACWHVRFEPAPPPEVSPTNPNLERGPPCVSVRSPITSSAPSSTVTRLTA